MAAIRLGVIFGAGIAAANLLLQFAVTPFLPWELVGVLSAGAWFAGMVAIGVRASRAGSLRMAAPAAAIATAVDLVRSAAVAIAIGLPAIPSSPQVSPTPGLIIAGTIAELFFIAPLAAVIGMVAARVTRRSPVPQALAGH